MRNIFMHTSPVRTLTLGIADAHPLTPKAITRAAQYLQTAQTRFNEAGYEVQTVRLSTRPLFGDVGAWSSVALRKYARELQQMLDDAAISFCSLGPAQAAHPAFPLERVDLLADLIAETSVLNASVQLADVEHGLRAEAAMPIAHVMKRLASETEEGFGNFRFAMLACVPPGGPFFPAAYHEGPASVSIGLQGAGIVADALRACADEEQLPLNLLQVSEQVRAALIEQATPIVALGQQLAREFGLQFGGIDVSPAPMGEDSIVSAIELCGYGPFGTSGTLAVAAALTAALKSTGLPTCGYNGLMLPVLEDALLGQRWTEGLVNAHQLLLYSAVCGTGLDTVPLPGDSAAESIAYLLLDVATLAVRLQKPLSARLFPAPGKRVGEYTTFTSQYLTNTLVR
jgi:hypothetical protein